MRFTKLHGIGNDYIYVNGFDQQVANPAEVARRVSDRHFGIGADGLILVLPSTQADVRMQMFNADGSEAEMCGNGIRCLAKFAFERGISRNNPMRVETGRGVLTLQLHTDGATVQQVTVDMGEPILDPAKIPFNVEKAVKASRANEYRISIANANELIEIVPVSMGNPHAVMYVADPARIELERAGPVIEHHPAFPRRVNAHYVQVISRGELRMRTWERGSGITLACGTGACAVCVAGVLTDRNDRKVLIHLPGGDLNIHWQAADNHVHMTGPATEVFSGEWNP